MKKKILKLAAISALMLIFSSAAGIAQQAHDQYGFGNRVFLIQSALEVGKSANGLWDIPGKPKKTNGNLKGSKWQHMGLWQREAGDPEDRLFRFSPGQASAAGRYFIYIGRSGHWGVNAIDGTGKIEARSRADHFELKHMGNGRWKIYYKNGMIVAPASRSSKNGTKLILLPDQNSPHVQWVFFDKATNRSFIPAITRKPEPVSTIPDFFIKNKRFEYSAQGNMVYYKAKGTAEVKKIEGDVAYVTVNISESESEGRNGIEKKGRSTFEVKFTRKGDTYYMDEEKNGDMAPSGKVDASGLSLDLYNDGGSNKFNAVK